MARIDPVVSQPCKACMRSIADIESAIRALIDHSIVFDRNKAELQVALDVNISDELLIKNNMDLISVLIATLKTAVTGADAVAALSQDNLDQAANM